MTRRDAQRGAAARPAPWRPLVVALLLAAALALVAEPARAGTFRISQCNAVDGGGLSPRGYQSDLWWIAGGFSTVDCGTGGGRIRVDVGDHRLRNDWEVDADFAVPGAMAGTSLRTAWLDWTSMPQAPSTNPAYLVAFAGDVRLFEGPTGSGTTPGAAQRVDLPAGARAIKLATWCSPLNGPGWCNWPSHLLELRGMTVELEESGEPDAAASGPLIAPGEHSGTEPLELTATDGDSGVRRVDVTLGGAPAGSLVATCRDDRLPPCSPTLHGTLDVDTTRVPDGPRRLRLVVTDAAGNVRTRDPGVVTVHNQPAPAATPVPEPPPAASGSTAPAPAVPPASIASPARPAPFPRNPLAGRGHAGNGTHASEHARVTAWLEPASAGGARSGAGVRRTRAVTVRPGVRVRIRGRVTDERGRPIGGAALPCIAREPGLGWRAITGVRTRPNGRFTAFTRIGPSRLLRFVYYAYGDSTRGIRSRELRVTVRR
ncbi:MAG: hypothetical protein QOE28_1415 [Solirubrobacteraceae bacterium]|nr:hypothetical protein [Solirubrobacteraceae bacterium]